MYAIIDFKGQQHKVKTGDTVKVSYLADKNEGDQVEIATLLLLDDENKTNVGNPQIKGAKVLAEVLGHGRDKKIIVFKKKRRKSYSRKKGHRQDFSKIKIKDIIKG